MKAFIYVHANGEIVEKFVKEIKDLDDIKPLYQEMNKKYSGNLLYCFVVMINNCVD